MWHKPEVLVEEEKKLRAQRGFSIPDVYTSFCSNNHMMEVENKDSELRQINARFNAVETQAKNAEVRWCIFTDGNASYCLSVVWIWILNGQVERFALSVCKLGLYANSSVWSNIFTVFLIAQNESAVNTIVFSPSETVHKVVFLLLLSWR